MASINPVCTDQIGLGPLHPTFAVAQFVAFMLASAYIFVATALFVYFRFRDPRSTLSKRSLAPLVLTSLGSIFIIMTRSSYDLIGRDQFPCSFSVMLVYLAIPLVAVNDVVSFQAYVYQLQRRAELKELQVDHQAQMMDSDHSLRTWFKQFGEYLQVIVFLVFKDMKKAKLPLNISPRRQLSFEFGAWLTISLLLFVTGVVRVYTEPQFEPANGCTACRLETTDFWILLTSTLASMPQLFVHYYATRALPDPLGVLLMGVLCGLVGAVFGCVAIGLVVFDPSGIMESQAFDWFIVEQCMYVILFTGRVPLALHRYLGSRALVRQAEDIRLSDCIDDAYVASLLEDKLKAELASENFEFFMRAREWKRRYKENDPAVLNEAQFIVSLFIGPDATFPINISDACAQFILKMCGRIADAASAAGSSKAPGASGPGKPLTGGSRRMMSIVREVHSVPPVLFDDAMAQTLQMMEFGAFIKVRLSDEFKMWVSSATRSLVVSKAEP